jgi:predicted transcriptional regulator
MIYRRMAKRIAVQPKRQRGRPRLLDQTKAGKMPGKAFIAWQAALGLTDSQAARQLGTSPSTIARYRIAGGPAVLALACAYLAGTKAG